MRNLIIVEIVDTQENVQRFLDLVDEAIVEGIATLEEVETHFHRPGRANR